MNDTDYSHLQEITPMIVQIMAEEDLKAEELDAVAVSRGPGSFTGIRIGMATAKGFAQIWNKPVICVPTLDSFAWRKDLQRGTIVVPVFDARREQVYAAAYLINASDEPENLINGGAYDIENFQGMLSAAEKDAKYKLAGSDIKDINICCFGDGCHLIGHEAQGAQEALQVLALAEKMYDEGRLDTAFSAEPEYMRLAEAERKLKEKENKL